MMPTPWCLLRLSLFPQDFDPEAASDEDRARFDGALGFVSPGLGLHVVPGDPTHAGTQDAIARYGARVRHRSGPRGLFAAAAVAIPGAADASLGDVEVEVSSSRELERLGEVPPSHAGTDDLYGVAPEIVIHPGGVCRHRYNPKDQDFDASALHMPESLRLALMGAPGATLAEWDARFKAYGVESAPGEDLPRALVNIGLLKKRGRPLIHNGPKGPDCQPLTEAIAQGSALHRGVDPKAPGDSPTRTIPPLNAFATFKAPIAMPAPLDAMEDVAQLLARCAIPAPTGVSQVLMDWLDGRWCSLAVLERYAEGVLRAASPRKGRIPGDNAFVDWVRDRGLEPSIDLGDAPLPAPHYEGPLLVASEWTSEGRLLEPFIFGMGPRELMGRYGIKGLPERLKAFDRAQPCLVAYHGPRTLGDIAEVYAPGVKVLEYCGTGSEASLGLSLNQIEVTASGAGLIFRDRETLEQLILRPSVPLNETLATLHPLMRLLLGETRSGLPVIPLFKRALQDFPVRPRLTYKGHIIRRRRAVVPKGLTPEALGPWLRAHGLGGQVALEVQDGRLAFDPQEDSAIRRLLFKELRGGKTPTISEFCQPEGVRVDGRRHAAHALVPLMMGTPKPQPKTIGVPPPSNREGLRGPFTTLTLRALPEAIPRILGQSSALMGPEFQGFYVNMGGRLDGELRLRIPQGDGMALGALIEMSEGLLGRGACRTWSTGPYLREWDRYGGERDIAAIEAFFVADSQALIGPASTLGLKDKARNDLYTLAILQTLAMAGFDGQEALGYCRGIVNAFSKEFALDPGERRGIGAAWRGRKAGVMTLAMGKGDGPLHQALLRRRRRLQGWMEGPGGVDVLKRHVKALIHMTGTRCHVQGNRYAEGEAHFYAAHALGEWCHRGGVDAVWGFLT